MLFDLLSGRFDPLLFDHFREDQIALCLFNCLGTHLLPVFLWVLMALTKEALQIFDAVATQIAFEGL